MNNTKKLQLNSSVSLVARFVMMISGIILPRLILSSYGSEINGLVSSVSQFLSVITFLDLGVGSVVQSALYKPLAEKDIGRLSAVLKAAQNYFRKIAYILVVYVLILIIIYPQITNNQTLNTFSTVMLIIAMSISTFGQYFLGIVNELLLNADQRSYVQFATEIAVVILNLIASIILINLGYSIVAVKFASSFIYLLRPVLLSSYVKKHYDINYDIELKEDPLPQKWNGVGQHIAYSIQNNTDVIVLTFFSTLENVSVYSIYKMVVSAVKMILSSFTVSLQSFFGNILAKNQMKELNNYFNLIEWAIHNLVIFLYSLTSLLIIPFVQLYTRGVNDVSYNVPVFAITLVIANAIFSIRTPYQSLVFSAGHFKETQIGSYVEAGLNILISVLLIDSLGLVGIALGSLVAMLYRLIYLINYLSKNILKRPKNVFFKLFFVDIINFSIILILGFLVSSLFTINHFGHWIIVAIILALIALFILLLSNWIFYRDNISYLFDFMAKKRST